MVRLIGRLQALRGQPLWTREQPTLAQPCVASAADVAAFVQTGEWHHRIALPVPWLGWLAGTAFAQLVAGPLTLLMPHLKTPGSLQPAVVDCFYFDTALRERWCAEALRWTCGAHSRHFASRSHQVGWC